MKKSNLVLLISFVVMMAIPVLSIKLLTSPKEEDEYHLEIDETIELETVKPYYLEGDEDITFNYLSNINQLNELPYPLVALEKMGYEIDLFLKKSGFQNENCRITEAFDKEPILEFNASIGETNSFINVKYDMRTNEFVCVIGQY